jgi:mannose-6-phosphate isomerase-like protein (cupin superfamily)
VRAESLSVIEERMPAGASEVRHFHRRARQFFYVLEGSLHVEVEERHHQLRAGEGLEIPPDAAHQVRNAEGNAVRFLVVSQPPSHGDRELAQR